MLHQRLRTGCVMSCTSASYCRCSRRLRSSAQRASSAALRSRARGRGSTKLLPPLQASRRLKQLPGRSLLTQEQDTHERHILAKVSSHGPAKGQ